jgi:hypothetical protein
MNCVSADESRRSRDGVGGSSSADIRLRIRFSGHCVSECPERDGNAGAGTAKLEHESKYVGDTWRSIVVLGVVRKLVGFESDKEPHFRRFGHLGALSYLST